MEANDLKNEEYSLKYEPHTIQAIKANDTINAIKNATYFATS